MAAMYTNDGAQLGVDATYESPQRAKNSPCRCRGANRPVYLDFLRHV